MILDGIGAHRWHLFVVGVVIWLWSTKRIGTAHFGAILALCMLGQSLHNYSETPEGLIADWGSTMGVCVGMVCVALTAYGPDWNKIVPDWAYRPIRWFAGISYGVFLMHQTMGYLVSRNLQDWGFGPTTQTIAMVATGVLLGWALTKVVERPVHKFLMASYDRMFPRRAAAPAS
jgi:peptidoglycan/LPS O-acetylase OafA/YrhL